MSGRSCHSRVDDTTSVARKVSTPVGRASASHPDRSSSTSSPGRCGAVCRIGGQASAQRLLEAGGALRVDVVPGRQDPRRWLPGQQSERGRRQPVDVGRPGRHAARRHFGSPIARRPPAGARPGSRDTPKSTSTTAPVGVSIRLAGLTSPCTTGGSVVCRWVSASATGASHRNTVDGGSPADHARSTPPRDRSRRPSPSPARGGRPRRSRLAPTASPACGRSDSSVRDSTSSRSASRGSLGTRRNLSATSRPCRRSTARTSVPSPPRPTTASTS